jgi:hypothetical protein
MQAFRALDADEGRRRAIKEKLIDGLIADPGFSRSICSITGGSIHDQQSWVNFGYPTRAPVQYLRYGIEWTDHRLRWTHKVVDNNYGEAVSRLLNPTALMSALPILGAAVFATPLQWLGSRFGNQGHKITAPFKSVPGVNSHQDPGTTEQVTADNSTPASLFERHTPKLKSDPAVATALEKFKRTYAQRWSQTVFANMRGTCYVNAVVHWKGPRGSCHVHLKAEYLPSHDIFVRATASKLLVTRDSSK